MTTIYFKGKTYNSPAEMPPDERVLYEKLTSFMQDQNHNGIPDLMEGDLTQKLVNFRNLRLIVNGQEVQSIDLLPPEARARFDQAMAKLNQMGIATPRTYQPPMAEPPPASLPQLAPSEPAFTPSPSFQQSPPPSAITYEDGPRWGMIIGILAAFALLGVCVLSIATYFFMNH